MSESDSLSPLSESDSTSMSESNPSLSVTQSLSLSLSLSLSESDSESESQSEHCGTAPILMVLLIPLRMMTLIKTLLLILILTPTHMAQGIPAQKGLLLCLGNQLDVSLLRTGDHGPLRHPPPSSGRCDLSMWNYTERALLTSGPSQIRKPRVALPERS